jgi:hypothetical protein
VTVRVPPLAGRASWPWLGIRALRSLARPGAVCAIVASVSALPAAYDLWKVASIAIAQLSGPATPTDFLNLYAGAALMLCQPWATFQLDAQLVLQRSLTGNESQLVPFYLPPYAALALAWLAWLPYGMAYLVWLVAGVSCLVIAAYLLAPHWTRWYPLVWLGVAMLFLPTVLGLGQGQTSALMLLCFAVLARALLERSMLSGARAGSASWGVALGMVGWLLKPQLAPLLLLALTRARRWRVLGLGAAAVGVLGALGVWRLGPAATVDYLALSRDKTQDALAGDPVLLIGPTLLHASHMLLGVNMLALGVAAALVAAVVGSCIYVWWSGPAQDDAILLQLAILPVAAVVAAPYALIYELTAWLGAFWLLLRYTHHRPRAQRALLWLASAVLIAANLGVAEPHTFGADAAALLGLCCVWFIAWLFHAHVVDPSSEVQPQLAPHWPIE